MVEWKKLGEIASYYRGVTYNKKQEVESNSGGIKILRANNITLDNNSLNFDDVKEIDNSVKIRDNQWLYPNDILICSGSGSKEHVGKVAYIDKEIGYAYGGFMGKLVTKSCLNSRYLFHILCGSIFKDYLKVALNSTTINNLNSEIINNFPIPTPSLPEQERIVGILDTFTSAIDNLKAQIAQRRKQYEFYRDQLLDLEGKEGVEMKTLGEVCSKLTDGSHFSPKSVEHGYYMPSVKDMTNNGFDYSNCKQVSREDYEDLIRNGCKPQINDVLIAKDGSMLKYVFPIIKEEEIAVLSSIAILTPRTDIITSSYLSHYLKCAKIREKTIREFSSKGGVPRIILKNFKKICVCFPPLSEQQRIVSILDTFEASIQNLEAQLKQREKQYEYYRNKLLTFE